MTAAAGEPASSTTSSSSSGPSKRSFVEFLLRRAHPRYIASQARSRLPAAGLHPRDEHGQYISSKPTSKRNRRRSA